MILRRDNEALLQLRQNTGYMDGYWATAAAGHVEDGESVLDAAVREAHEEIGVTVVVSDLIPVCTMHRTQPSPGPFAERVDFFFQCFTWQGEPRVSEPDKAADLRWFDLGGLPSRVVAHEQFVLSRLHTDDLPTIASFGFHP